MAFPKEFQESFDDRDSLKQSLTDILNAAQEASHAEDDERSRDYSEAMNGPYRGRQSLKNILRDSLNNPAIGLNEDDKLARRALGNEHATVTNEGDWT